MNDMPLDLHSEPAVRPPLRVIVRIVADAIGTHPAYILNERRNADSVRPRQIIMFIATEFFGYSQPRVGHVLRRDDTTVIHGRRVIETRLLTDPELGDLIKTIVRRLHDWQTDEAAFRSGLPQAEPTPASNTLAAAGPSPQIIAEMHHLRHRGWSVKGLSRRFEIPQHITAHIVGAEWWAGPRYPSEASL